MGVLFAGFLRVPLTSVFMVLEVSGNYSIILPVIVAKYLPQFRPSGRFFVTETEENWVTQEQCG
jgi:hypothetical protein